MGNKFGSIYPAKSRLVLSWQPIPLLDYLGKHLVQLLIQPRYYRQCHTRNFRIPPWYTSDRYVVPFVDVTIILEICIHNLYISLYKTRKQYGLHAQRASGYEIWCTCSIVDWYIYIYNIQRGRAGRDRKRVGRVWGVTCTVLMPNERRLYFWAYTSVVGK